MDRRPPRAKDETPDFIAFTAKTDQAQGEPIVSEIRQFQSHDGVAVAVLGAGATYRVCTDSTCSTNPNSTVATGTAERDSWIQLQHSASSTVSTETVATLAYGTLTASFSVRSGAVAVGSRASKTARPTTTLSSYFLNDAPNGSEICI